jgi:RNA polymerase sigma-70 factor (ECF subfamily)
VNPTDPALVLLESHKSLVYHLIGLHVGKGVEADDAYQEIYLQVRKALPSFRAESKPSTWLYRVVLNTLLQLKRSALRQPATHSWDDVSQVAEASGGQTANNDAAQRLDAALRQLPVLDQTLIGLYFEGFDAHELGDLLGMEPGTISVRIHRIKKKLQQWLNSPH